MYYFVNKDDVVVVVLSFNERQKLRQALTGKYQAVQYNTLLREFCTKATTMQLTSLTDKQFKVLLSLLDNLKVNVNMLFDDDSELHEVEFHDRSLYEQISMRGI